MIAYDNVLCESCDPSRSGDDHKQVIHAKNSFRAFPFALVIITDVLRRMY